MFKKIEDNFKKFLATRRIIFKIMLLIEFQEYF